MVMSVKIKSNIQLSRLIELCDYNPDDGLYYSKKGLEYVNAIKSFLDGKNFNDIPFTVEDIVKQPVLGDFKFKGVEDFKYICKLKARPMIINKQLSIKENEKILVVKNSFADEEAKNIFMNSLGVDYILTCPIDGNEHIIKIGNSRTTFNARLGSYNCGVITNARTASTTNLKILQSFVATRLEFNLYLLDCSDTTTFTWHGVESVPFASPKSLAYEDILVKEFIKQYDTKPLANVQANATTVTKNS